MKIIEAVRNMTDYEANILEVFINGSDCFFYKLSLCHRRFRESSRAAEAVKMKKSAKRWREGQFRPLLCTNAYPEQAVLEQPYCSGAYGNPSVRLISGHAIDFLEEMLNFY